MEENHKEILIVENLLRKKEVCLDKKEIKKFATNLYEIGLFLVQLKIKQHSKQPKPPNDGSI